MAPQIRVTTAPSLLSLPQPLRHSLLRSSSRYASSVAKSQPPPQKHNKPEIPPAISYLPPPSNDPNPSPVLAPPPHHNSLAKATTIFTSTGPTFLYSASRFLELPVNTKTPEICLIGRSNVGKSTLINALSGLGGSAAGSTHGLRARKSQAAITSRRAGCTQTLNGYGFGDSLKFPPIPVPVEEADPEVLTELEEQEREAKRLLEEKHKGATRSERRQNQKKIKEPAARFALVMTDMPGYGLGSQRNWGVEIQKYLAKRKMLKGAILLVDAVAGLKDQDIMVLETLRNAELRTAVVLTKVDKLLYGENNKDGEGKKQVEGTCLEVWDELRKVEQRSKVWLEGEKKGWEREVWVTGAGDPKNGQLGVEGARWAICRMAGLVEDRRKLPGMVEGEKGVGEKKEGKKVEVVSFDDIVWAVPKSSDGKRPRASF
ncbi:P-loop containing nucleoside triphosphate hydrolase protein [Podospora australis]|uniref:P-loop containing nucleoside triphosphate hydrolase protein n=1 Tax=Podospora australis TaxID=1536484 RepID=A0AAN6X100_9PEZI|nr:P-loop containing nucleoside triphosphate hydrolase protein [Podospora australis]